MKKCTSKKAFKIIIFSIFIMLILVLMCCIYRLISIYNHSLFSSSQDNTKWLSDDKKIELVVSDDDITGTIQISSTKNIDIVLVGQYRDGIFTIIPKEQYNNQELKDTNEKWVGTYFSQNKLIVTVKEANICKEGQEIVFKKVATEDSIIDFLPFANDSLNHIRYYSVLAKSTIMAMLAFI